MISDSMITNKDITIIIPVYNCEQYIEESITSCLDQTNNIIVINDGSTDRTLKIIESLKNNLAPEIKLINLDKNYGTAKALNEGIKASRTDFIKWLSADDVLKEDAIKCLIEQVNRYCYQNNRIFYTHYDIINANGEYIKTFMENAIPTYPNNNSKQIITLLDHFYGNGSTSLIHKDIFTKVGLFDETLGYQEDYDFWLRAVCLHDVRLTLLSINTLNYRMHDRQLTAIHKGKSLKQSQYIRSRIIYQKPELNLLPQLQLPLKTRLKRYARSVLYR